MKVTMLIWFCAEILLWSLTLLTDFAIVSPCLFTLIFLVLPAPLFIMASMKGWRRVGLWFGGYLLLLLLCGMSYFLGGFYLAFAVLVLSGLFLLLCKQNRARSAVLWLLLLLLPLQVFFARQYSCKRFTEIETRYLDGSSSFDRAAQLVMPSLTAVEEQNAVFCRGRLLPNGEFVLLKESYQGSGFSDAVAQLKYPFFDQTVSCMAYCMTPAAFDYRGFHIRLVDLREYGDLDLTSYAMAVGTNETTQEILYMFYESSDFEYMGADLVFQQIFDRVQEPPTAYKFVPSYYLPLTRTARPVVVPYQPLNTPSL